jgi:hypothetical protein
MVTYAVSFVKANSDNFKEELTHVRFFDTDNFTNACSFLASLKKVKKLRITGVEWELEECSWFDYYDDISNTIH